jgi:hypothetical protein
VTFAKIHLLSCPRARGTPHGCVKQYAAIRSFLINPPCRLQVYDSHLPKRAEANGKAATSLDTYFSAPVGAEPDADEEGEAAKWRGRSGEGLGVSLGGRVRPFLYADWIEVV